MIDKRFECCILGAGPAGMGVALELIAGGIKDIVIVDTHDKVGGLARTETYGDARFDIGPHRFFTKNKEVDNLWHETLGTDFIPVNRLTRIYYKNKFFYYPIKPYDALAGLGIVESIHALASFAAAKAKRHDEPKTFEDWITNKFGRKLYETFFKTYTEKVWGIPCKEIGAEWASQRIKGLDMMQVLRNAFTSSAGKFMTRTGKLPSALSNTLPKATPKALPKTLPKTLVDQFDYPRLGAGQMYEAMCEKAVKAGVTLMLQTRAASLIHKDGRIKSVLATSGGNEYSINAKQYFSSIPLTHFFRMLRPEEPVQVMEAVEALYYRDHITVNLLVGSDNLFPDQWIYVHSPEVAMARLANYNNFSAAMVNKKGKTALSVEYFVFQHEDLWKKPDDYLKNLAVEELSRVGLIKSETVEGAWVVRETEAYPTYYLGFGRHYDVLKARTGEFGNICQIGRGGMYKYNNQDHSIYSGLLAARNYRHPNDKPFNLWDINIDTEYHESGGRK
ncbi:MAG: FAD-dependent oxidoreductase [Nitrospirae bacterium]|nr:FAD-dependent oxidoreductase [Nitrospirota bacterium]